MAERINWTCPRCNRPYSVPTTKGLTICPDCKARAIVANSEPVKEKKSPFVTFRPPAEAKASDAKSDFEIETPPVRETTSFTAWLRKPLDLFDWQLKYYLTPWILRGTWSFVAILVTLGIAAQCFDAISNFGAKEPPRFGFGLPDNRPSTMGLVWRYLFSDDAPKFMRNIWNIFGLILSMLYLRVILESGAVFFNISNSLSKLAKFVDQLPARNDE